MLWYCAFTWHPGTTQQQVRARILQQHEAGMNKQEHIRGWYNMVGGGAGFLLIESSDPQQVDEFLLPYMDIMSGDVRAVNALDDIAAIDRLCQSTQTATGSGAQELVP